MARHLTKRQRIFVAHYLKDGNGTKAAIAAGYSKKGARVAGVRLLTNANVSAEITEKSEKLIKKLEISAENVLQEIARLAFLDPSKFFDANGRLIPIAKLDDDTKRCLASLDVEELFAGKGESREQIGVLTRIKFVDKGINLERLGRYLKLFTDKHELSDPDGKSMAAPVFNINFVKSKRPASEGDGKAGRRMTGFVKLFGSILGSTIWREDPATKVVWITLLALADIDGIVESSIPGLANYAGVGIAETETALQKFQSPDPYSRTPEHEGRRIEPVDGGWRILNHDKYRCKMSPEEQKEKAVIRQRRHRDRLASLLPRVTPKRDESVTGCDGHGKSRMSRQAEVEVEVEVEAENLKPQPLAHSANEREGVDSVEVSAGNTSKSKRLTAAKRMLLVENLYDRYPRKIAKAAAFKVIEKAIVAVARRDHAGDEREATDWLGVRVDLYAKSAQARQPDKSKVPYPATWFNAGRYDDDEQEWNHVGLTKGGARAYEMLDGHAEDDAGLTEVLSRPDPEWVEAGSR
jgi:phage terminase small subunit